MMFCSLSMYQSLQFALCDFDEHVPHVTCWGCPFAVFVPGRYYIDLKPLVMCHALPQAWPEMCLALEGCQFKSQVWQNDFIIGSLSKTLTRWIIHCQTVANRAAHLSLARLSPPVLHMVQHGAREKNMVLYINLLKDECHLSFATLFSAKYQFVPSVGHDISGHMSQNAHILLHRSHSYRRPGVCLAQERGSVLVSLLLGHCFYRVDALGNLKCKGSSHCYYLRYFDVNHKQEQTF